jgi:hypothetical protein
LPVKPETRLIQKTIVLLREHGFLVTKIHGDPRQPMMLDLVGNASGWYFEIEAKVGKNEPTDLQKLRMQQVREAGGITGVFRTPEEALELIEQGVMSFYAMGD